MKDDPIVYTLASVGTLGIAMILSDKTLLLIIFLLLSLFLAIIGIKKSYDNKITKIICIIIAIIVSIYLLLTIALLLTWGSVSNRIKSQWSQ